MQFLKSTFRLASIHLRTKVSGSRISTHYIQAYLRNKPTHEKDQVFLMYDSDVPEIVSRLQKIPDATLLLSNPCIELWFLLHFKEQRARLSSKNCIKELIKYHSAYKKGYISPELGGHLSSHMAVAARRAKEMDIPANPSSSLYVLIFRLMMLRP